MMGTAVIATASAAAGNVREIRITIPQPHTPAQREVIETPDSAVILAGGRWGKTTAEIARIVRFMINDPGLYWWIGLDRGSASYKKAWRELYLLWSAALRSCGQDPRNWINRTAHEINVPNGSRLMFRTAANPQSIAGDGPKGIIGDEFTYWSSEVYERFIMPATLDHHAWVHLIGRPHGENWGFDLWRKAAHMPGWRQLRYTVYDNPLLDRAEIETIRANTPDPVWQQEYMAEPGSGDNGVIPLAWVLAAVERWKAGAADETKPLVLAVDVSEGGEGADLTTFAWRRGWRIDRLTDETPRQRGAMLGPADLAADALRGAPKGSYAIVDNVGSGAMFPAYLRRQRINVVGFKAGAGTKLRDASGQFGFENIRSAAWWHLRELLNPETGADLELPDDRKLIEELTAPTYDERAGAKLAVQSKKEIRKRIGRSTDRADAVVMALWTRQIMAPSGAGRAGKE
jgi:hypothetical protein